MDAYIYRSDYITFTDISLHHSIRRPSSLFDHLLLNYLRGTLLLMEQSNNTRQAMWVGIGQFFSFAIGIVTPMILSRFFNKSDYGTYKQVMYIYSTLLAVFSFGLPRAYSYFIPRVSEGESKDVIRKITKIFNVIGFSFAIVLFLGSQFIAELLNNKDLEFALKVFSPTPLFLLPVMGLDCILASYKRTKLLAVYTISTKIFTVICIVAPVILFNGTYVHALIGFDVASFLSLLLAQYLRNIPSKGVEIEKTTVSYKQIISYSTPLIVASLWIMMFQSANQFFVSRYYGNEVFAEFSNGFMDFPVIPMVVGSVATVLMPYFSRLADNSLDDIKIVWTRSMLKSVKITYPIVVFCIMFANLVMTCFYGVQYAGSSPYFVVKSVEGLFIVIPFYPIILALGRTKDYSRIHMIMALAIFPFEYIIVLFALPAVAIGAVYVLCSIIKVILQFYIVGRVLKVKASELIPFIEIGRILFVCILASLIPLHILKCCIGINHFILLFVVLLVFLLCYYLLCWFFKISYKEIVSSFIPTKILSMISPFIP